jgi:formimidoylglutamate deiminase
MKFYRFNAILQKEGWVNSVFVGVDSGGTIAYLNTVAPADSVETVNGFALPGFQNAHSHAFQFAMAGTTEKHAAGTQDDFWTWREAMYNCALNMDPDQMEAIATMLYAELLRNGYTHVAEFHYLHHDKSGDHYGNYAEMGERLIAAAATAGIKITLVPIFYQKGNFGIDPYRQQRRFISRTTDDYFHLLDDSASAVTKYPDAKLGFGVHSLRAVDASAVLTTFHQGPQSLPFHLHAAEQLKEVEDCKAFLNKRPVEWLIENLPLNDRCNIVHCTHLNDSEVSLLGATSANVVLCPGTEGNLGDGIFRLVDFAKSAGTWSIGTDSRNDGFRISGTPLTMGL